MLAFLFWGIFLAIVIAILCCIMPWWLVPLIIVGGFIGSFFTGSGSVFNTTNTKRHQKKLKKAKNQGKANEVNIGAGTLLAGAALAHRMWKHHKHNDTKDITDDKLYAWDDGMDELYDGELDDIYDYDDNIDYDAERAAYEEQAAYDDFIASMDMDDN